MSIDRDGSAALFEFLKDYDRITIEGCDAVKQRDLVIWVNRRGVWEPLGSDSKEMRRLWRNKTHSVCKSLLTDLFGFTNAQYEEVKTSFTNVLWRDWVGLYKHRDASSFAIVVRLPKSKRIEILEKAGWFAGGATVGVGAALFHKPQVVRVMDDANPIKRIKRIEQIEQIIKEVKNGCDKFHNSMKEHLDIQLDLSISEELRRCIDKYQQTFHDEDARTQPTINQQRTAERNIISKFPKHVFFLQTYEHIQKTKPDILKSLEQFKTNYANSDAINRFLSDKRPSRLLYDFDVISRGDNLDTVTKLHSILRADDVETELDIFIHLNRLYYFAMYFPTFSKFRHIMKEASMLKAESLKLQEEKTKNNDLIAKQKELEERHYYEVARLNATNNAREFARKKESARILQRATEQLEAQLQSHKKRIQMQNAELKTKSEKIKRLQGMLRR